MVDQTITLVVASRRYGERIKDRTHIPGTLPIVASLCGHHAWAAPSGVELIARGIATICTGCAADRTDEPDVHVTPETIRELEAAGMSHLAEWAAATFQVRDP